MLKSFCVVIEDRGDNGDGSKAFKIFVKVYTGQTVVLEVNSKDGIKAVKQKIRGSILIPSDKDGGLFFNDDQLDDSHTLADYNIQEESTLCLKIIENITETRPRKKRKQEDMLYPKPRILVIFRGHMCSGKSTCFKTLQDSDKQTLPGFVFIDHVAVKNMFRKLGDAKRRENGKRWVGAVADHSVCDSDVRGIIVEEISEECLRNYMKEVPENHGFHVLEFRFKVSEEIAYLRNVERREKRKLEPRSRENMRELRGKWTKDRKEATINDGNIVIVSTDKMDREQTVSFVLNKITEHLLGLEKNVKRKEGARKRRQLTNETT
mmetsp:Transcript_1561/g.2239  ORF Transcript_1561/g.2239 Transcript_1561/m.2239 type:complete len:321 (-) Transcript_1561:260-1222(-)